MKRALLISTIISAVSVSADDSTLNPIVVVATKSEQSSFDVPAMVDAVNVNNSQELTLASTLDDVLAQKAAVQFDGSARRNGQNITLRGFDKDSILVTVDGVRQNFSSQHDGNYFIDPSLLKSVEVARGAHSPLYGSGSLGGVVQLETLDAHDLLREGQTKGARLSLGYETVNEEFSTSLSGYGTADNADAIVSLTYRDSGDIELADGNDLTGDDNVLSGLVKVNYTPAPGHNLQAYYLRYQNDSEEPNNPQGQRNDLTLANSNQTVDKEVESQTFKLEYAYDNGNALFNPQAKMYYTDTSITEEELTSNGTDPVGTKKARELETLGLELSNVSNVKTGDIDHRLQYGIEYYKDEQNGKNSAATDGEYDAVPDAEVEFVSVYVQDEISLDIGKGELLIVPGLRYDDYSSEDTQGNDQDESEFSPKIAATYKPNDNFMVFGSYAEAFRAPNVNELYASGTHFTTVAPGLPAMGFIPAIPGGTYTNQFVANPALKPESGKTFEIGAGVNFDDVVTSGDELFVKGSYYNTEADDFIDIDVVGFNLFDPTGPCPFPLVVNPACSAGSTPSVNLGRAEIDGFELAVGYENDIIRATASYSYIDGEDKDTGEYIYNLTPQTLNTQLVGKLPQWDAELGWNASYVAAHKKVNDVSEERKGYGVHGVFANWQPNEHIGVSVGVDNIFDKEYARTFAGAIEAGRNYKVKTSFKW